MLKMNFKAIAAGQLLWHMSAGLLTELYTTVTFTLGICIAH